MKTGNTTQPKVGDWLFVTAERRIGQTTVTAVEISAETKTTYKLANGISVSKKAIRERGSSPAVRGHDRDNVFAKAADANATAWARDNQHVVARALSLAHVAAAPESNLTGISAWDLAQIATILGVPSPGTNGIVKEPTS